METSNNDRIINETQYADSAPRLVRQGYYDSNGNLYFHYYCVCGVGMGTPNLCGNCDPLIKFKSEDVIDEVIEVDDDSEPPSLEVEYERIISSSPPEPTSPLLLKRSDPAWRIGEDGVFSWKHPCVCGRNGLIHGWLSAVLDADDKCKQCKYEETTLTLDKEIDKELHELHKTMEDLELAFDTDMSDGK